MPENLLEASSETNAGETAPSDQGAATDTDELSFADQYGAKGERLPDNLKAKLKTLLEKAQKRDLFARREELKRVQKNRFFELGMQHLVWDEDAGIFQVGQQGGGALGEADEDDGPLYQRDIQLYLAYELSFRSVFCQNRPTLRFKPVDAKDAIDITAAQKAEPAKRLIESYNDPQELQDDIARLLWTDGSAIAYTKYVRDGQRFGYEEDDEESPAAGIGRPGAAAESDVEAGGDAGSAAGGGEDLLLGEPEEKTAKGREVIQIVGVLERKCPLSIKDWHRWPYLVISMEDDIATSKGEFPDIEKQIRPGTKASGNEHYARLSRITCSQGASWYGTAGATLESLATVDRAWFRPSWFTECGEKDDNDRKELERIFPKGVHAVFVAGTFAECYPESMEDHIKPLQAMRANGQNVPGTGNRLLDPAEAFDDMWNMSEECFKFTIPAKIFRHGVLDLDAINEQKSRYGGYYEANDAGVPPERPFADNFFEETPVELPAAMPEMMAQTQGPLMQFLSGQLAPLMGQSDEHNETAKGITILRDQALGLMAMVWAPFCKFYGEVMVDAIRCAAENRDEQKPFADMVDVPGKKGQQELVEVNVQDLKGNILAAPVVDSNFPESWSAKSNRFFQIFSQAGQNPLLLKLLNHPDNHALAKDLLGLEDFEDPDADSRDKQIQEIQELSEGQPMAPDPEEVQGAIAQELVKHKAAVLLATQAGAPVPQEPNPQVLEQQLVQKLTKSSVEVDPECDNHVVEMEECDRWINSAEGQRRKRGNDQERAGFLNVRLHRMEHKQFAQALVAQQQAAAAGAGAGAQ